MGNPTEAWQRFQAFWTRQARMLDIFMSTEWLTHSRRLWQQEGSSTED